MKGNLIFTDAQRKIVYLMFLPLVAIPIFLKIIGKVFNYDLFDVLSTDSVVIAMVVWFSLSAAATIVALTFALKTKTYNIVQLIGLFAGVLLFIAMAVTIVVLRPQ